MVSEHTKDRLHFTLRIETKTDRFPIRGEWGVETEESPKKEIETERHQTYTVRIHIKKTKNRTNRKCQRT